MPPGSVPSWAVTSSSTSLFGGGGSKANGRAAADAQLASSSNNASSSASQQQQLQSQVSAPLRSVDHASSSASATAAAGDNGKPYQPKRKQRSITHCPPLASAAPTSRAPGAIPYVDECSANDALYQLIAVQAKRAGFDATTASALHEVSQLTKKFLTSVFSAATHASELACRGQPSARDLVYALETHGQPIRELREFYGQQSHDANEEDEGKRANAQARSRAREHARAPKTYRARGRRAGKAKQRAEREHDADDNDWTQGSINFLPSDSDDGSEMDAWSVSSNSDDEHGKRRSAVHARVMKRKHDLARAQAKQQRRQDKLRPSTTAELERSTQSSSLATDMRALTSGERAWRRVADHVVPRHLPGMPPRHAWMQTPAFPTNAYGTSLGGMDDDDEASKGRRDPLMLVNRKLANARLVEASLRRLIQNTDGAAAVAYSASSMRDGDLSAITDKEPSLKAVGPPVSASPAPAATVGGFAVPKTPASGGLTLRLNRKISLPASSFNSSSQPSTPIGSRRPSIVTFGNATSVANPGTPLGMGMSLGWGGEPLMSPLTPISATAATASYPPTPGGMYGHYFGSNPNANAAVGRSRSQSIIAAEPTADKTASDQLGVRIPGPVNYKNVWYAPGSAMASGGLSASGTTSKAANHPRGSVKRMRKWKV